MLNILDPDDENNENHNIINESKWDVILDKGVIDTFLFRSKSRGEKHIYTPILEKVLNNVWYLMSSLTKENNDNDNSDTSMENESLFIVISPRSKLKAIRDYSGFIKVERHQLIQQQSSMGELVSGNKNSSNKNNKNTKKKSKSSSAASAYVYVCHKNEKYNKDEHPTYKNDYRNLPTDDAICPHCGITFHDFCNGQNVLKDKEGRDGVVHWTRQWKGHCIHCKAPHHSGWT